MSKGPTIIVKGDPRAAEVIPVMHNAGTIIPLFPKHFPEVMGSHEEVVDAARIWLRLHPEFARKWESWKIASLRVDGQVEIRP